MSEGRAIATGTGFLATPGSRWVDLSPQIAMARYLPRELRGDPMVETHHLRLPYIAAAQAQKHVTHNEAIRALDAIVHLSVLDRDLTAPPGSPAEGDRYIVGANATGAWAGQDANIAAFQDGAWMFYVPQEGWLAWVGDEDALVAWAGAGWVAAGGGSVNPAPRVGVNTTADATNKLAVKSDAVLLSHDDVTPGSGDHRVIVNKSAAARTASFLFQTGYSGRAEFGTTGDDKFHIKTSPNGINWSESIVVDPATGWVGIGGETSPSAPLHIRRGADKSVGAVMIINDRADDSARGPVLMSRKSRGTHTARKTLRQGDVVQAFWGQGYDGRGWVGCANLRWVIDGPVSYGNVPTMVEFWTSTNGIGQSAKFEITNGGTARPSADNAYSLGDANRRWSSIWAANGTIQPSDARDKTVLARMGGAQAAAILDAVDPVLFRWKVGGNTVQRHPSETEIDEAGDVVAKMMSVPVPGQRTHAGFLAQDVKAAMAAHDLDFGAWGLEDKHDLDSRQWLRPDQLIPVLWAALRETRAEVEQIKSQLK